MKTEREALLPMGARVELSRTLRAGIIIGHGLESLPDETRHVYLVKLHPDFTFWSEGHDTHISVLAVHGDNLTAV